ncbi:MAG: molybdopterin-dependent oxidoreductase, partial [Coriobacteriales bacterium]|nr:molybdopterin-dependent oxidoreductase [Coriobacteriales bacterium]
THLERVYAKDRLKYPLRRTGERGENKWERISWDEAIDEICTKWKQYQSESGKSSVAIGVGGGNTGLDFTYVYRLPRYLGATILENSYDLAGVHSKARVVADENYLFTNDCHDLVHAKTIINWGTNQTESGNVYIHFTRKAQQKGTRIITIDPNFTTSAAKSDEYHYIRPGSDGLLAIAMMQIIYEENLADFEVVKQRTVGPFLVKKSDGLFLRLSDLGRAEAGTAQDEIVVIDENGAVGTPLEIPDPILQGSFTIEGHEVTTAYDLLLKRIYEWDKTKISELTTMPLETIYDLTHQFMSGPSTVITAYGPDHYVNGHTFYYNMLALLQMSGQITKPGTGTVTEAHPHHLMSVNHYSITNPVDAEPGPTIFVPQFPRVVESGMFGDTSVNIKSLWVIAGNHIGNLPERKTWIEVFKKLDFVVVSEIMMTETALYADIVLPVPHYFEQETVSAYSSAYHRVSEVAIPPAFESRGDFEVVNLIGAGMGLADKFGYSREEFLTATYDNDYAKSIGLSYPALKEKKHIFAISDEILENGMGFNTPTGRAQFYLENNQPMSDYGQPWDVAHESLPYWEPPHEAWFESELFKKYPIIFMSERAKFKVHTQFTRVQTLLELDPEPYIKMNPEDAAERGIAEGDTVKVYNDRGYVVLKVAINNATHKGIIIIDHGWEKDQFIDGHYSDLSSLACHAAFPNTCYFDVLCEVEKV